MPAGVLTAQFGPIRVTPSFTRLRPKVKGAPINCRLYSATSVQINVSCLALMPPMISEPAEHRNDPAVFVDRGSHSAAFSWSEKAISRGSMLPLLAPFSIGSAPNTKM